MNDLRKAAEMALEALERLDRWLALRYGNELTQPEKDVVEALRKALAHEALDRMVAENQRLGLYDDVVNISAECVDEKAKDRLVRIMGTFDLATGHADTLDQALDALEEELRDVLGHLRAMREWVGLTDVNEMVEAELTHYCNGEYDYLTGARDHLTNFAQAIEAKLREKNT